MKINGKTIKAKEFAYDGCHKIYLIEDKQDQKEAIMSGYDLVPISELEYTFNKSCGLQFISNWKLSKSYADQFQADVWFED